MPSFVVPVAMYWAAIGLAIWGIEAHWHPEQWLSAERDVAPHFDVAPRSWVVTPPDVSASPVDRTTPRLVATPLPPSDPDPVGVAASTAASFSDPSIQVAGFDPARPRPTPRSLRARKPVVLRFDPVPSVTLDDDTSPILQSPHHDGLAALTYRAAPPSDRATEPELRAATKRTAPLVAASCEAAIESAHQDVDLTTGRGAPDITRDAYASVLDRGTYLASCDVPSDTGLDLCVAVQDGRAVGVTVTAMPSNLRVVACVRRALSGLAFPVSARMDVARTHFAPAAR